MDIVKKWTQSSLILKILIGLAIGAVLMVLIARNFHYLADRYPEPGGIYTYTKTFTKTFFITVKKTTTKISLKKVTIRKSAKKIVKQIKKKVLDSSY